jgi:AAA domain
VDLILGLSLPRDNDEVEAAARETDAALLLLDPLISRISTSLNSNLDPDVRRALEPLTNVADRVGMTMLGIIHLNKTSSVDILDRVIGSKAFAAVARAVCAIVPDPDDATNRTRLFGVPKNNLGRDDLPSIQFTIQNTVVATDDDATSNVGQVVISGETATSIREAMERNNEDDDVRTLTAECKEWLRGYLTEHSHTDSRVVKEAANKAGFTAPTINRARKAMRIVVTWLSKSSPATVWSLPPALASPGGVSPTSEKDGRVDKDARPSGLEDLAADIDEKVNFSKNFNFSMTPPVAPADLLDRECVYGGHWFTPMHEYQTCCAACAAAFDNNPPDEEEYA